MADLAYPSHCAPSVPFIMSLSSLTTSLATSCREEEEQVLHAIHTEVSSKWHRLIPINYQKIQEDPQLLVYIHGNQEHAHF